MREGILSIMYILLSTGTQQQQLFSAETMDAGGFKLINITDEKDNMI